MSAWKFSSLYFYWLTVYWNAVSQLLMSFIIERTWQTLGRHHSCLFSMSEPFLLFTYSVCNDIIFFGLSLLLLLTVNLFSLCCYTVFSQSEGFQPHAFNFKYFISMLFKQFLSPIHFISEACQFFSEYCINYWRYKELDTLVIFIL